MSKYKIIITLILFYLFQTTPSISLELKIPKDLKELGDKVKKEEVKKEEVKIEGILIFDCVQVNTSSNPKDYIKYEIDTSTKTFRQIFKYSNKENPIIEKNVSEGGVIDSKFYPPYGFIYQYTDYLDATYGFDYGPGDEFIDYDRTNAYNTKPSMKCVKEK